MDVRLFKLVDDIQHVLGQVVSGVRKMFGVPAEIFKSDHLHSSHQGLVVKPQVSFSTILFGCVNTALFQDFWQHIASKKPCPSSHSLAEL